MGGASESDEGYHLEVLASVAVSPVSVCVCESKPSMTRQGGCATCEADLGARAGESTASWSPPPSLSSSYPTCTRFDKRLHFSYPLPPTK